MQILFIEKQRKETESEISWIIKKLDFSTITRIDNTTETVILSEIGNISKFDSPKNLVAFAWLDAIVKQSGESNSSHNVMSKRGSPYLRKTIF